eukprot:688810-Rhodomonas_salina.3
MQHRWIDAARRGHWVCGLGLQGRAQTGSALHAYKTDRPPRPGDARPMSLFVLSSKNSVI